MDTKHKLMLAVALLVLIGSLIAIYRQLNPAGEPDYRAAQDQVGGVVADEAAKLLPDGGQVAVLSFPSAPQPPDPVLEQARQFIDAMSKRGSFTIVAQDTPEVSPDQLVVGAADLSTADLRAWLRRQTGADIAVVFGALGRPRPQDLAGWKPGGPKVILVTSSVSAIAFYLETALAELAVVPRFGLVADTTEATPSGRDQFDRYYRVVRRGELGRPDR